MATDTEREKVAGRPRLPVAIDPLRHPAWDALLAGHPESSFFHGCAWAQVLHETYGHQPAYFGRLAAGELADLLPVMEVSSPWTGRRGVSLPFTDFCAPLAASEADGHALYDAALAYGAQRGWRYLECRGTVPGCPGASPSLAFHGHVIDLQTGPDALFKGLDAAVRRGIRKAEAAGLQIEFGVDLESVRTFYALHCQTRKRHGLPPQPFRFFENIARFMLHHGEGSVLIARTGPTPVAAAVFFHHGRQALYKFGASDYASQRLRPNNLLMWEAMKRYAGEGFTRLHLGRTSLANEGLRRFKLGFGAAEHRIEYTRYDFSRRDFVGDTDRAGGWFNHLFRRLPLPLLRLAGRALYPHLS
ncbi:MAG TPA: GNAT family N-acetyltransferase [Dongiaceae bacterium]|nr:GNAT family N-acetyltransferase [Dongiaceae bacterium]